MGKIKKADCETKIPAKNNPNSDSEFIYSFFFSDSPYCRECNTICLITRTPTATANRPIAIAHTRTQNRKNPRYYNDLGVSNRSIYFFNFPRIPNTDYCEIAHKIGLTRAIISRYKILKNCNLKLKFF